jgi:hypothetical protein
LVSAALASYQTYLKTKAAGADPAQGLFTSVVGDAGKVRNAPAWERRLVALSDALARRDFIYAVVFLAFIGRLDWFLWPCAIGANVYALVLALLFVLTRR